MFSPDKLHGNDWLVSSKLTSFLGGICLRDSHRICLIPQFVPNSMQSISNPSSSPLVTASSFANQKGHQIFVSLNPKYPVSEVHRAFLAETKRQDSLNEIRWKSEISIIYACTWCQIPNSKSMVFFLSPPPKKKLYAVIEWLTQFKKPNRTISNICTGRKIEFGSSSPRISRQKISPKKNLSTKTTTARNSVSSYTKKQHTPLGENRCPDSTCDIWCDTVCTAAHLCDARRSHHCWEAPVETKNVEVVLETSQCSARCSNASPDMDLKRNLCEFRFFGIVTMAKKTGMRWITLVNERQATNSSKCWAVLKNSNRWSYCENLPNSLIQNHGAPQVTTICCLASIRWYTPKTLLRTTWSFMSWTKESSTL